MSHLVNLQSGITAQVIRITSKYVITYARKHMIEIGKCRSPGRSRYWSKVGFREIAESVTTRPRI